VASVALLARHRQAKAGRERAVVAAAVTRFSASAPPPYIYAIGGLLVGAVGLVAVGLRECGDWRRHLAWALVALFAVCGVRTYVNGLLQDQQWNGYRKPIWYIRLAR
jgi:hypothetical protein